MTFSLEQFHRARAGASVGEAVEWQPRVVSTNDVLAAKVREGCPDGLVIIADAQTAGRGRRARSWFSPPGVNLYLSAYLAGLPATTAPMTVYAAGIAVARCCERVAKTSPFLKWPNDVHVNGRKLCGILCESHSDSESWGVIVGIGLNVNMEPDALPSEPDDRPADAPRFEPTSLSAITGASMDRAIVAGTLARELDAVRRQLTQFPASLRAEWERRAAVPGVRYTVREDDGTVLAGVAVGLAADGALLLDIGHGPPRAIYTADVLAYERN